MMETANTHKPANRTLVVIDGGMNAKAYVQTLPTTQKPKLLEQVKQAIRTRQLTTMIYAHVLNRGGRGVQSPADTLSLGSMD